MVTSTFPGEGPCTPWIQEDDILTYTGVDPVTLDAGLLAVNITNASDLLYRKSGMQFNGFCDMTLRPCCDEWLSGRERQWWADAGYGWVPQIVSGQWYNMPCWQGGCGQCLACECGHNVARIDLGEYPVTEATVKIDGVAFTDIRLDYWRELVRTDGQPWPRTNDLNLPDTEVGTWSVAVSYGDDAPSVAKTACATLAVELTRHCMPGDKCSLPLRITNVTRQGVTYSMADVMDLLNKNRTGLYVVDLFLQTYNPTDMIMPPRVLTPDLRPPRRLG